MSLTTIQSPNGWILQMQPQPRAPVGFSTIALVRSNAKVIAGVFVFGFSGTLIYKYAASRTETRHLRPNDFLVANLIEYAVANGYRHLDFGTSRLQQTGLRRFKSKWGATESSVFVDRIRGFGHGPTDNSRLLSISAVLIRQCPDFVCRGLGELFYRFHA